MSRIGGVWGSEECGGCRLGRVGRVGPAAREGSPVSGVGADAQNQVGRVLQGPEAKATVV